MRTSADAVKNIIETSLSDAVIEAYIASANIFVTDALGSSSLSDDTLENIEMWVAAHFMAVTRERMAKKEGAGGAEIEYTGEYGVGLNSTSYGQMAILLDTTSTLSLLNLTAKRPVSIKAITSFV